MRLTADGRRKLKAASRAAAEVERRMLTGLDPAQEDALRAYLISCIDALETEP